MTTLHKETGQVSGLISRMDRTAFEFLKRAASSYPPRQGFPQTGKP